MKLYQPNRTLFKSISTAGEVSRAYREHVPAAGVEWSEHTWTRKEFLEMCRISPTIDREEFERCYFAFDGGEYDNLTMVVHGHLFRIDKRSRQ